MKTGSLYVDLLIQLHKDAADAVNALLRAKGDDEAPLTYEEIIVRTVRDPGDGRIYVASAKRGVTSGYAGDRAPNEVEALCSLIEKTNVIVREAGGIDADTLVERAAADAEALTVYRRVVRKILHTWLPEALADLDHAAEAHGLGDVMRALDEYGAKDGAGVAALAL